MTPQDVMEFIDVAHLSHYVDHPSPTRGGVMFVAPPETFKTSIMDRALKPYPDAMVASDTNVQSLIKLREDFTREKYTTLAFREFQKLYERDPRTASGIEGIIRSLAGEGFTLPSFVDPRIGCVPAYAMILGCMTEGFYHKNFTNWEQSGFCRRFIWLIYWAKNTYKATDALLAKQMYPLDGISRRYPGRREIAFSITESDKGLIRSMLKEQIGETIPALLLAKMLSCLKWKYKQEPKRPYEILESVAPCLTKSGGVLVL